MSRRKKHAAHANHERWLVSYADFITLLFAFFVVLYASSQVDNKKVQQVSAAIEGGFQQLGVFSGSAAGPAVRTESTRPNSTPAPDVSPPELIRVVHDLSGGRGNGGPGNSGVSAAVIRKELEDVLGKELKEHQVDLRLTPGGLVISLREIGFFDSGEAVLLPQAEPTLAHVASALNARSFEVRVEGHTDDVPIHNSLYRSNWDLSTARATEVVNILTSRYNFNPERISVAGYAQYHPIAGNDTEEGRRKNRRIDLVIVSNPAAEASVSAAEAVNPAQPVGGAEPVKPAQPVDAAAPVKPARR